MPDLLIDRESLTGIAIDLGGTKLAVGRFIQGELIDYYKVATNGKASVDELVDSISDITKRVKLTTADKVVLAVTGRVDQQGHWYAVNSETLSFVNCIPLRQLLSRRFGQTVHVLNDALAGTIAEHHFGAGEGCQRMVYLTVSTGVGAGIILNGTPLMSPKGLVGHTGFMSSRHATQTCGCGRTATVESIASGRAIAHSAAQLGHTGLSAKDVFQCHYEGQRWATDILMVSARAIADLCSDLVALLDIELVVIGGSIGLVDFYHSQIQAGLNDQPPLFRVPVKPASLGQASVLLGALAHGLRA